MGPSEETAAAEAPMEERPTPGVVGGKFLSVRPGRKSLFNEPWSAFLRCRRTYIVTVEPVVFLYMFGVYLMLFISQQYFFWRYANQVLAANHTSLNHSGCIISSRDLTQSEVDNVQKSVSTILSYTSVPGLLLSMFTALILGPLSDTLGRKFIIVSVGTGVMLQGVVTLAVVHFELDMHIFMVGGIISGIFGGYASVLAASFAYAADVSTPGRIRSIRISLVESMIYVAGLISVGGAGKLLEVLNCSFWPFVVIYIVSGLLIILYTVIFLPEPFSRSERLQRAVGHPTGVRRLVHGLKLFFCSSSYSTWRLWTALVVIIIIVANFVGVQTISGIFQEGYPLRWSPAKIGYYAIVTMASHGITTICILPLLVYLTLPDVVIALIGMVFSGGMAVFTGFITTTWEMMLIGVISGMEAVILPSLRSVMSKLVSGSDQGAMFAFIASMELLASAFAAAFYPNIIPVFLSHGLRAGYAYLIMAALCVPPFFLLIVLLWTSPNVRSWWTNLRPASSRSRDDDEEEEKSLMSGGEGKTSYGAIEGSK